MSDRQKSKAGAKGKYCMQYKEQLSAKFLKS